MTIDILITINRAELQI